MAAVPFLLSICVSAIVVAEIFDVYGTLWTGSDDIWYLTNAGTVVSSLHSTGGNLSEAWSELTSVWEGAAWTLAGWPFLLGVISFLFTSDDSPEILHAIALSLNASFLSIVLALVFHVLKISAQRFPKMVLASFLLLIGDPIVYAGQCLKESMLQLSLMLAFISCLKISGRIRVQWIVLGLLGMTGVATTRPAYIPLILLVLYWIVLGRIRMGSLSKVIFGLVLFAIFGGLFLDYQIRGIEIGKILAGHTRDAEAGLAMSIYNIPVIGPVLYYAIAPAPPLPWKILSNDRIITTLLRGVGSILWCFATCYVLRGMVKNRLVLKEGLFVASMIMFAGLFMAAVLYGDDPRYKQTTNVYLAIMLFLTWYNGRLMKNSPGVKALSGFETPDES